MLSACWLIGVYFLAVSSHKHGRLNTSVYGKGSTQWTFWWVEVNLSSSGGTLEYIKLDGPVQIAQLPLL